MQQKSILLTSVTLNTSQDDILLLNSNAQRNIHSMFVTLNMYQEDTLLLNVGKGQKTSLTQDQQNVFEK